ncbi:MAG: hypothetical protein AAGE93_03080 [Bacteroidota bacterium]
MKRIWHLSFVLLVLFVWGCSEDEAAEQPSFLTLEERIVQPTLISFNLRVKEEAGEGMVYFNIFDPSDPVPTTAELKGDQTTQSIAMKGGGFTFGNFQGLTPNTSYVIYGFMEVGGVEGKLTSLQVTTAEQ